MRSYRDVEQLIAAVRAQYDLSLTIVGEGPLFARYRDSGEMPANVRMLGSVSDGELSELYATHDVIALPSLRTTEAYGLVLLEGMALGCVPVASDLPGVSDVQAPPNLTKARQCLRSPPRFACCREIGAAGRPEQGIDPVAQRSPIARR